MHKIIQSNFCRELCCGWILFYFVIKIVAIAKGIKYTKNIMDKSKAKVSKTAFMTVAGLGLLFVAVAKRKQLFNYLKTINGPFKRIEVIQTVDECQRIVGQLQRNCEKLKVVGFDCEWVTVGGTRRPVAMLQLSAGNGFCALFRLCCMKQIPKTLRDFLEDDNIIKVGVAPQGDAQKLAYDYGVGVASTLDLRFLASLTGVKAEGLAKLSKSVLNIELDKHWRLVCSDWEAKELSEKQIEYAANDAFVAIEIFKILSKSIAPNNFWSLRPDFETIRQKLEGFYDVNYSESFMVDFNIRKKSGNVPHSELKSGKVFTKKAQVRGISTRSKCLYDNCLLQAPDGELLCTIERRKAKWYIDQELGTEVQSEPLTVRLNFEPAGRAIGDVGKYYQLPKENQCVVCGQRESLLRKNVVPREYRKHFPEVMKSHTSHDILLLCQFCHQFSNISDLKIRQKLSKMCNAPLENHEGSQKKKELPELRQVKSAARALLKSNDKIPEGRKLMLHLVLLNHFKESEITFQMLQEAADIDTKVIIENYNQHGEKVVKKFQEDYGGLLELERIWRIHFINTMQPKYLPKHWNINHNANRLKIRFIEGRVNPEDLKLAAGITM